MSLPFRLFFRHAPSGRWAALLLFIIGLLAPLEGPAQPFPFVERARLFASDGAAGDAFGAVAISGDTAIIGASLAGDPGSDSGSAYLFQRDQAGNWVQFKKLTGNPDRDHNFGGSVAISGDTAIVGAYANDNNH